MTYHNTTQEAILNPVGLDKEIENICDVLDNLTWHTNIFRRAWQIVESNGKKGITKAKTYLKDSHYYDVLSNANFASLSFITVDSEERYKDDVQSTDWNDERERDISIVFWVNLKQLSGFSHDYIYTEVLKREVEKELKKVENLQIKRYLDEDYRKIFKGFDFNQKDLQLLTYPYAGFRFECIINYGGNPYSCD